MRAGRRARVLLCSVAAFLGLGGTAALLGSAHASAGGIASDVTEAKTWCLDSENSRHVAAAADAYGSADQRGENVEVGKRTLTVEEWSQQAEGDFEAACERAFSLYGPQSDGDGGSSDTEEWLIPILSALGGTAVGAGAAHYSTVLRDRKLWIREDAAMIRRLSIEVRSVCEEAERFNPGSAEGTVVYARLGRAASDLSAILDDPTLTADPDAATARTA